MCAVYILNLEIIKWNLNINDLVKFILVRDKSFAEDSKQIYSNKIDTSDFHGTVSFDPIKMSQQTYTKMFIKRPTKVGNYLILSSYLEELLNLK